ncbi:MAG: tail tape measure protein [Muribaculaceae bacterium]|nr:tail tape measure protein [Muribaculaceae bacterium]
MGAIKIEEILEKGLKAAMQEALEEIKGNGRKEEKTNKNEEKTEALKDNYAIIKEEIEAAKTSNKSRKEIIIFLKELIKNRDKECLPNEVNRLQYILKYLEYYEVLNSQEKYSDNESYITALRKKSDEIEDQRERNKEFFKKNPEEKTYRHQERDAISEEKRSADERIIDEEIEKLGEIILRLTEQNIDTSLERKLLISNKEYDETKERIEIIRNKIKKHQTGYLSEEQERLLGDAEDLNEQKRQCAIAEAYKEEFGQMQEYLRQYGTFQEQKLAIASEYAEKIRKAGSEAERLTLTSERDSLLAGVKTQEIKNTMDWSVVFGEFGSMFGKVIEPVLANARQYLDTDEFRNSDQASQQTLIEAIQQMERSVGGADNVSFKRLGAEIKAWQKAMESLTEAQEEYKRCYEELEEAQRNLIEAQKSGAESEIQAAEGALKTAQENEEAARKNVESLQDTADTAQRTVSNTATTLKTSMDGVVSGLQKLASGSLSGAYSGLIEFGNNAEKMGGRLGKAFGKIADKLEDVPVIGWIASIIDIFKDGMSVVIGGLLDAVFNAVSGILDDVLSGDLFKTLGESILSGVGKIFDALTWGGFSSWFGSGDSDKNLEKDIEYLTASNKDLQKSIDNLAEKMEEGSVADAKGVYEHQKELLEQQQANTQEMMQRSAAAYSNGFMGIGGHHSSNSIIDKGMTASDWGRISEITGKDIRSAGDFFGLSSEDMAKVFNEATDLYSKIKSLADDGYKDAAQYMDDYIEYYRQLEELQDAYREKVTGMSFNSLRDEFKSALMDMESDAETFAENLDEIMMNALVESLMSEKYSEMLKDWYKEFADAMANDGKLTDAELTSLRNRYQAIVDGALKERDAIADAIGYESGSTTSQSGKAGAFTAMSQDQGTKLEGLFTSVQMHTANMDAALERVAEKMSIAEGHLVRIAENTGASAGHLKEIRTALETIKRDGLRTR